MESVKLLDCGHYPSQHGEHTTGTAHTNDGREICWDCANSEEAAAFSQSSVYGAYLSEDGKNITTWPGGVLAQVLSLHERANNMAGKLFHVVCKDANGRKWYGDGIGRGCFIKLHKSRH